MRPQTSLDDVAAILTESNPKIELGRTHFIWRQDRCSVIAQKHRFNVVCLCLHAFIPGGLSLLRTSSRLVQRDRSGASKTRAQTLLTTGDD